MEKEKREANRNTGLRAWMELREEHLAANLSCLRKCLNAGADIMAVVKADGYGHGAEKISRALEQMGVRAFAVATLEEGILLRRAGIRGKILILGYTDPAAWPELARYSLIQTVVDASHGEELNRQTGVALPVHLKIDTGMNRLGISWRKREEIGRMFRLGRLQPEGVYSHLCVADSKEPEDQMFTRLQIRRFRQTVNFIHRMGYREVISHLQSSYGLICYPEAGFDFARPGIALYGVLSSPDQKLKKKLGLKPVLSLRARVAAVKELRPGDTVGYGRAFTAEKPMRIADVTMGYCDGLPRNLRDGRVLLRGKSCRLIGRICMDQCTVDVTEVPEIRAGDTVTFIGTDGNLEITAEEVAEKAGTITNELLSRLGSRLERIWIGGNGGKKGEQTARRRDNGKERQAEYPMEKATVRRGEKAPERSVLL